MSRISLSIHNRWWHSIAHGVGITYGLLWGSYAPRKPKGKKIVFRELVLVAIGIVSDPSQLLKNKKDIILNLSSNSPYSLLVKSK